MAMMTREQILDLARRCEAHAKSLPRSSERTDVKLLVQVVRDIMAGRIAVVSADDMPEASRASHSSS